MSDELLAKEIARRFIARRDVKAIQYPGGAYTPHTADGKADGERIPWKLSDIKKHIARESTFGHYLLDTDSKCKLFAFDIDLITSDPDKNIWGYLPFLPKPGTNEPGADPWGSSDDIEKWERTAFKPCDPRTEWLNRKSPARPWMKLQFKLLANKLMKVINEELDLPCAAAYSGNKGIHVYGFTGYGTAHDARTGAQIVLDVLGEFEPTRGTNFFKHKNDDPFEGYPNLSIEVFPKQDTLAGKDLGNLMRLPLGRNLKTKDPTFFIDMTTPLGELSPADPLWAIGEGALNPWKRQGE